MRYLGVSFTLFALLLAGCGGGGQSRATPPIPSASLPTTQLQTVLDTATRDGNIPGAILAVQTSSETWMGASGVADLRGGESMDPNMEVRIGGVSKQFTAALILKLAEEHKLSLSDSVEHWVPNALPNGNKITIGMLLNHTSGIYDHESDGGFWAQMLTSPNAEWGENALIQISRNAGQGFAPGTSWAYCNTGYYLLGVIAETAGGDNVENMLENRFFGPLGMVHTRMTRHGLLWPPFAHGYCRNYVTGQLDDTYNWNWSWDWTSGSCCTNAADMLVWTKALFGGRVLSGQFLQKMITPTAPSANYGCGVYVKSSGLFGGTEISDTGSNPGYTTYWAYMPSSQLTVFLVLNRCDPGPTPEVRADDYATAVLTGVRDAMTGK